MSALEALFNNSPTIAAARSVLFGQLFSGGITLRRDGAQVELTPVFQAHISTKWLSFATDVFDSALKWGVVAVAFDDDEELRRAQARARARGEDAGASNTGPTLALVPIVPPHSCIKLGWHMTGKRGYTRTYDVHCTNGNRKDEDAHVFVRQAPDSEGNVCSPMSSVFELGIFVDALSELALTAEITLARPRLVTETQPSATAAFDAFTSFDTFSRELTGELEQEQSAQAARNLAFQQELASVAERMRFRPCPPGSRGGGVATGDCSALPPPVPPSIFTLPVGQKLVAAPGNLPQPRADLESLMRLSVDSFCAAFGVPAATVFNTQNTSSTAELAILNSTVKSLATFINSILTFAYVSIYGTDGSNLTLELQIAPLAATNELIAVHKANLAPLDVTIPLGMKSIGATQSAIQVALEQAQERKRKADAYQEARDADAKRQRDQRYDAGAQRATIALQHAAAIGNLKEARRAQLSEAEEDEKSRRKGELEEEASGKRRRRK